MFVTSLVGFFIVTIFSYVQHYGLVRAAGTTPIEKRHAWNHRRPISRLLTFEIVTHSMHHIDPSVPYWKLPAYRGAAGRQRHQLLSAEPGAAVVAPRDAPPP